MGRIILSSFDNTSGNNTKFYSYCLLILLSVATPHAWLKGIVGANRDLALIYEYGKNEHSALTLNQSFTDSACSESDRPLGLGAASNTLLTLLYQKVPVLVPLPLWQVIVEHRDLFKFITEAKSPQEIYQRLKGYPLFSTQEACNTFYKRFSYIDRLYKKLSKHISNAHNSPELKAALWHDPLFDKAQCPADLRYAPNSDWFELAHYLLCTYIPLKDFTVKKVALPSHPGQSFLLFLPNTLLKEVQNKRENLGLAVEKFPTVRDAYSIKFPLLSRPQLETYDTILIDILRSVFTTNKLTSKSDTNRWNIYCMGHGIYSENAHELIKQEEQALFKKQEELKTVTQAARSSYAPEIQACKKAITDHQKRISAHHKSNLVCGMPIEVFTNFLVFLDKELSTALLYYSSCSSGGKHFIDAFTLEDQTPLTVSYTVLADALVEAPSTSANPLIRLTYYTDKAHGEQCPIDLANRVNWGYKNKHAPAIAHDITSVVSLVLDTLYYFNDFFACARTITPTFEGVQKLIASLNPTHQRINKIDTFSNRNFDRLHSCSVSYEVVNLPSIRLPGQSRFFCIDDEGPALVSCNAPAAANTRNSSSSSNKQTITLDSTTQALLLYTPHLEKLVYRPTESTTVSQENNLGFPALVSMIPGKASHTIDELYAPKTTLSALIKQNFPFFKLYTPKLMHIKKLTCINDCPATKAGSKSLQTFYDVILVNRDNPKHLSHRNERNKLFFSCTPEETSLENSPRRQWYSASWSANREVPKSIIRKVRAIRRGEELVGAIRDYFADANSLDDYRKHRSITSSEIVRALRAPLKLL